MESELVVTSGYEDKIDISFYQSLIDDAVETIGKYGDVDEFISDEPYFQFK